MSDRTFIACRPGMQSALQKAFIGIEVVVDDALDKDYEFRERPMTFEEVLEEETSKQERQEADPKNAMTFIVPMATPEDLEASGYGAEFLAVRVQAGPSYSTVADAIRGVYATHTEDGSYHWTANMSAIRSALRKAGFNVLSISQASGLVLMKER